MHGSPDHANAAPPAAPPLDSGLGAGRAWGVGGTLLWGVAIYAVIVAAQVLVALVVMAWWRPQDGTAAVGDGLTIALAVIAACPPVLAVIALAVRLARARFAHYLALGRFRTGDLFIGLASIAVYLPVVGVLAYLLDHAVMPTFVMETYRSARDSGALVLLIVAVGAVAPITEEFAIRGFLYRGWAGSWLGVRATVVLTAVLWAAMHAQYDWFNLAEIFGVGVIFGWLRSRSGSTWLTVILHGSYNMAALAQAAVMDRLGIAL